MLAGEPYSAHDPELNTLHLRSERILQAFHSARPEAHAERQSLLNLYSKSCSEPLGQSLTLSRRFDVITGRRFLQEPNYSADCEVDTVRSE
jgi:hypothetical protein